MACLPLALFSGFMRLRVVILKDARTKKANENAAMLACDAVNAIRTVASLTREEVCSRLYSESLEGPKRDGDRVAIKSAVCPFHILQRKALGFRFCPRF
jgi:ATP-binding cassette subfamily B (MDR/TAP) protein 1